MRLRRKWEEDHDRFVSCHRAAAVRRDHDNGVVTLTLNAPQNRNALSLGMIETLIATFNDIAGDKKARVVVLAGEGPALSSGHDLKEMQAHRNDADRGRDYYRKLFARCAVLMQAIVALPKPVIAAVEGVATAAGCQLVASCDLAIAGERARFALPGVTNGLFVLRRWWRSAGPCHASTPWRWR